MMTRAEFTTAMQDRAYGFRDKAGAARKVVSEIQGRLAKANPGHHTDSLNSELAKATAVMDRWDRHAQAASVGRLCESDDDHLDPIWRREMRPLIDAAYGLNVVDHVAEPRCE